MNSLRKKRFFGGANEEKKLMLRMKRDQRQQSVYAIKDENHKNYKLATSDGVGLFIKILCKWKGSVYKLLYKDLIVYLLFYYIIRFIYLFGVTEESSREKFEEVMKYCTKYAGYFPLSFVLGFFVSTVMSRWWTQFTTIPRPHATAVFVSSSLFGAEESSKEMRRTIVRYACLSIAMVLRKLSTRARKRFPRETDLIDAGLLTKDEHKIIREMHNTMPGTTMYVLPIVWGIRVIYDARNIGRIRNDFGAKTIMDELNKIRSQLEMLVSYNTVNISIVYSQVVTIACYSYFVASVIGSQLIQLEGTKKPTVDFASFPIFLILQFIFYMGWLKVGEALMNPFGDDDDDIDTVSIIDRNLLMSYLIVDKMHEENPVTLSDNFWFNSENFEKIEKIDLRSEVIEEVDEEKGEEGKEGEEEEAEEPIVQNGAAISIVQMDLEAVGPPQTRL